MLRELTSTRLIDCNTIDEYVNKIITTAHKLKELQFKIKEEMIGALLLLGLLEECKPMIMELESSGTAIMGDTIKVKLLVEIRFTRGSAKGEQDSALYAKASASGHKYNTKVQRCFACDKIGHIAAKCRFRNKRKNDFKRSTGDKTFVAACVRDE